MSAVTDILATLPVDDLADRLGATPDATTKAAGQAITSLLGGLHHNSQDTDGALSLAQALLGHTGQATSGRLDLDGIDTEDGAKIVKHALGATPSTAATALGAKTGTDTNLLKQLLPILAPIVLAYVASTAQRKTSGGSITDLVTGALGQSGSLSDLLGGVLGGVVGGGKTTPAPKANDSGGILGTVLSHLF